MTDLLAFDPGRICGCAWFRSGRLYFATFSKFEEIGWVLRPPNSSQVLIEKPQWRPHERKIDINDLIKLSIMVGELKNFYESRGASVDLVTPITWKHSTPKLIHNRRVLALLTPEELALLPKRPRAKDFDHNMVDAIGLGLWKLGRLR